MIEREIEDGELIITVNPFPQDIEVFKEMALEQNNNNNHESLMGTSSSLLAADQDKDKGNMAVAVVLVNGVQIQDKSRLKDGDLLCIGISSYFTLRFFLFFLFFSFLFFLFLSFIYLFIYLFFYLK